MTIVAGFVVGGGTPFDSIFLAADSRVNFSSITSEKIISKTDKAQKIRLINHTLVVGYAGDYYNANRMLDMLSEVHIAGISVEEIPTIISVELQKMYSDSSSDVSFYVTVPFYIGTELKWNLYEMSPPNFNAIKMNPGLHLIGMDAETRAKFKACYQEVSQRTQPSSFEGIYYIPLLVAFNEIASTEVNGIITIAVMNRSGVKFLNNSSSYDGGSNWVTVSSDFTGSFRFVNGKPFGGTTIDYNKIMDERNKRFDV